MAVNQVYAGYTLGQLVGQCRAIKGNIPATIVQDYANFRLQTIFDRKPDWSGNFQEGLLGIPVPVTDGGVSLTYGSTTVTGSAGTWPVSDLINTTIPGGILRTGYQIATPASMSGILADSYLYVDGGGDPEVVSVIEVRPTSFIAIFAKFHNPGCSLTSSSYTGRQLRLGNTFPILTITAVVSTTSLLVDLAWLGAAQVNASYTIRQMYFTIAPNIKSLKSCLDQAQGIPPLRIDVTLDELNRIDPQRSSYGYPQMLANRGVNQNGNMQWEIWPSAQELRQLRVIYFIQPPRLTSEGDRIPYFITPGVLFNGVMADCLRTKIGPDDPYYDPKLATFYDAKFEQGINELMLVDNERIQSAYGNSGSNWGFGGADFQKDHSIDAILGNF